MASSTRRQTLSRCCRLPYIDRGTQNIEVPEDPFAFPPTNVSASNPDNSINWATLEPLSSSDAVSPLNTIPYIESYFLGIQRELGRNTVFTANYVGSEGRHLPNSEEANPGNSALCLSLEHGCGGRCRKRRHSAVPKAESNNFFTCGWRRGLLRARVLPPQNGAIAFGSNPYTADARYVQLQLAADTVLKAYQQVLGAVLLGYTYGQVSMDNSSGLTDLSTNVRLPSSQATWPFGSSM